MKERILITVKTYPTISRTYSELVCTAGLREDGSWIRLYPVPFRKLYKQYKKIQWVEVDIIRNKSDKRGESYRLASLETIKILDAMDTSNQWYERKQYVLEKGAVYHDLEQLIQLNKDRKLSLATFKPSKIIDMLVESVEREWDRDKIETLKAKSKQSDMFDDTQEYFRVSKKLPYKFSYKLIDVKGKESTMMVEDWELGALFWRCLAKYDGDEEKTIKDVRKKYLDDFANTKDLYLFLGTTLQYDGWAQNPFIIIGTFTPPIQRQQTLF